MTVQSASSTFDAAAREEEVARRCERLVELARAAGADEAEAVGFHSHKISVAFEKGDLKLTQVDQGGTLGLRVFREGRLGFAASNQSSPEALERLAHDANMVAKVSPPDEHNVLPDASGDVRPAAPIDPAVLDWSVESAVETASDMVARTLAVDPRLAIDTASLDVGRSVTALATSGGVQRRDRSASTGVSLFGMAVDGDDVGGFDYWGDATRKLADLPGVIDSTIEYFTSAALGNLAAGAAETYRGPVLFSPDAFLSVFLSPVVSGCSAIAVQRGRSALADKSGEQIATPELTLVDDPTDLSLMGASGWDREGVPTERFELLKEGVLGGWMYNGYAAAVDGVRSTGHASGGARAAPGIGTHGLVTAPGHGGDKAAMLGRLDRGLLVGRFSGTVDPASGDFSGVAKSARWVEGGQVVRSVRETLISGNAFELLREVAALGSEPQSIRSSARIPWALVDGVSVTAG